MELEVTCVCFPQARSLCARRNVDSRDKPGGRSADGADHQQQLTSAQVRLHLGMSPRPFLCTRKCRCESAVTDSDTVAMNDGSRKQHPRALRLALRRLAVTTGPRSAPSHQVRCQATYTPSLAPRL
eukprot:3421786-Rhodomonas_salina.2